MPKGDNLSKSESLLDSRKEREKKNLKRGFHSLRKWKSKQEFWREVGEKFKKWKGIEGES